MVTRRLSHLSEFFAAAPIPKARLFLGGYLPTPKTLINELDRAVGDLLRQHELPYDYIRARRAYDAAVIAIYNELTRPTHDGDV